MDLRHDDIENTISNYVNFEYPTLVIAECVLVYLPPQTSGSLMDWFGNKFNDLMVIVYEMCEINDKFGQVMINNLKVICLSFYETNRWLD